MTDDELRQVYDWIYNKPGVRKPPMNHVIDIWHMMGDILMEKAARYGKFRKGYQIVSPPEMK